MSLMLRRRMLMDSGPKETPNYLCFTALEDGTFTLSIAAGLQAGKLSYIEYSIDDGVTWTHTDNVTNTAVTITTPTILQGGRVYWRGNGLSLGSNPSSYCYFSSTCQFDISGNVASMLYKDEISDAMNNTNLYLMYGLFKQCLGIIHSSDLIIPFETLSDSACRDMFTGCTNLIDSPQIKATSLIGYYSCSGMFYGCVSLVIPPNLTHISVGKRCYQSMFYNCSSLTTPPELPATTLADYCYDSMFRGCTNLTYIKMFATDISASNCLNNWMYNVGNTSDSIFVKHIDATWTTTGASGVPTSWTIIYYDPALDKYYLDQQRSQECDDHGNPI